MNTASLAGKRCVVTGATSGIGLSTAWALTALGAEVVMVGRDPSRGAAALTQVSEAARGLGSPEPRLEIADLSRMSEVDALSVRLSALVPIDVLVNCAGYYCARRVLSAEGLEMQFAVNYLAAFRLSLDLLPSLAPDARVAIVSSSSHYYGWIRWKDPTLKGHYLGLWAYEQSKLADVLFAYELSRRLERGELVAGEVKTSRRDAAIPGPTPTVFAVDPGLVNTAMGQKHGKNLSSIFWNIHRRRGTSPDIPADGIARLVSSPEAAGMSGRYWRDARPLPSSRRSYDEEAACRLWSLSEKMIGQALAQAERPADSGA
jgi:NAD(P)-dependent dehydrogenase (short-subunit alcohol dehydrogenase family)